MLMFEQSKHQRVADISQQWVKNVLGCVWWYC